VGVPDSAARSKAEFEKFRYDFRIGNRLHPYFIGLL
jgi:hypothetical protein